MATELGWNRCRIATSGGVETRDGLATQPVLGSARRWPACTWRLGWCCWVPAGGWAGRLRWSVSSASPNIGPREAAYQRRTKVREFLVSCAEGAPKRSPRDATADLMRLMEEVRAEAQPGPLPTNVRPFKRAAMYDGDFRKNG